MGCGRAGQARRLAVGALGPGSDGAAGHVVERGRYSPSFAVLPIGMLGGAAPQVGGAPVGPRNHNPFGGGGNMDLSRACVSGPFPSSNNGQASSRPPRPGGGGAPHAGPAVSSAELMRRRRASPSPTPPIRGMEAGGSPRLRSPSPTMPYKVSGNDHYDF